jgi:hypothetical protein
MILFKHKNGCTVKLQASGKRNDVGFFLDVILLQVKVKSSVLQAEFPNHSLLENYLL